MASKRVRVDHLRNVPLFRDCTRKELEQIAMHSDVVDVPAGRVLMHQGKPGSDAFVVLSGSVGVRRNGRKVADLGAGAIVGELALLDQGPRTATVECTTACTLLVLTSGALLGSVAEIPGLSHKLFSALASRLRELDRRANV